MRTVLLLLLAMLAIKTTTTTSATGQEACSKSYTSCVDKCVTRPSPAMQDNCMQACQTQSNACYSQQYGAPGPSAVTVKQDDAANPAAAANAEVTDEESRPQQPVAKQKTAKPQPRMDRQQQRRPY